MTYDVLKYEGNAWKRIGRDIDLRLDQLLDVLAPLAPEYGQTIRVEDQHGRHVATVHVDGGIDKMPAAKLLTR